MNIILYRIGAKPNEMDKSPHLTSTNLIDTISDYKLVGGGNPTDLSIIIRKENGYTKTPNYVYIQEFKRWYFVKSYSVLNNNNYQFNLHCDVLMSFKDIYVGASVESKPLYIKRTSATNNIELEHLTDDYLVGSTKYEIIDQPINTNFITHNETDSVNIVCVSAKAQASE